VGLAAIALFALVNGALSCAALIVQKLFEDAIVFATGGLIAVGLVLWLLSSRASRPR
jgi:hypothetical protein